MNIASSRIHDVQNPLNQGICCKQHTSTMLSQMKFETGPLIASGSRSVLCAFFRNTNNCRLKVLPNHVQNGWSTDEHFGAVGKAPANSRS